MFRLISPTGLGRKPVVMTAAASAMVLAGVVSAAIWAGGTSGASPVVAMTPDSTGSTAITTTVPATTATTALQGHAAYVGREHTNGGSGLPVDATVLAVNWNIDNANSFKVGDRALSWVRDNTGDMIFIEKVSGQNVNDNYSGVRLVPSAVVDIPRVDNSEFLCLGWCVDGTGKVQPNVIAIVKSDDTSVQKAWTVDWTKGTLTARSTKNLQAYYEQEQAPPADPARPALYDTVATSKDDGAMGWYATNEGITSGGGWAGDNGYYINNLRDTKAQKQILVLEQNNKVVDRLELPLSDSQQVNIGQESATSPINIDVTNGSQTHKWTIDTKQNKFVTAK